jgi:hypothetical protein
VHASQAQDNRATGTNRRRIARPLLTEEDNVTITTVADTDDTSVHSASTSGTSVKYRRRAVPEGVQEKEAEVLKSKKQTRYAYATFPSELSADLFELRGHYLQLLQNRPAQDAARFRRKRVSANPLSRPSTSSAHTLPVDPVAPPFRGCHIYRLSWRLPPWSENLLAFANDGSRPEKNILSSYVPTSSGCGGRET